MQTRTATRNSGCIFFGAAGLLGVLTLVRWYPAESALSQNSYFYPVVLLVTASCLALLLTIRALLDRSEEREEPLRGPQIIGALAISASYMAGQFIVGFILSTLLFVPAFAILLGYSRPIVLSLFSAGLTISVWYVFTRLLNIFLPTAPFDPWFF